MARTHDMGGRPNDEPLNLEEHTLADWEVVTDALASALRARGLSSGDELRRAMENMPADEYLALSYYERWARGTEQLLVEKGILTRAEIEARMAELEGTWGAA
jgi:nitrile hydratase subunit beta